MPLHRQCRSIQKRNTDEDIDRWKLNRNTVVCSEIVLEDIFYGTRLSPSRLLTWQANHNNNGDSSFWMGYFCAVNFVGINNIPNSTIAAAAGGAQTHTAIHAILIVHHFLNGIHYAQRTLSHRV